LRVDIRDFSSIIESGSEELGLVLPPGALNAFNNHFCFLEEQNRNVNLTSISGAVDIARLHFLDSLALLKAAQFKGARVIDIGSGAGFPGIPLKIAEPSIALTLLDSSGKRVAFLSELCTALKLDITCVKAGAEEAAHEADMRESYACRL
jgi:16S rRNA (guanine527-N7)-methyltransferase